VFAALAVGLAIAGVRYRYADLQVVCDTPRCIVGQPTAEYVAKLAQMGESIDAVFLRNQAFSVISYDSILSFLIFALGGVLIWQKPGNAVSVLTALCLWRWLSCCWERRILWFDHIQPLHCLCDFCVS